MSCPSCSVYTTILLSEKIEVFEQSMAEIGFDISELKKGVTPLALYHILHKARGTKYELIVNNSILRSMAKAQYSANNIGHFGLVIDKYSHFTSAYPPVSRPADPPDHDGLISPA